MIGLLILSYLLVLTIGGRDNLRQVLVLHLDDILQEVQVGLIVVIVRVRLVQIRNKGCTTTSAELGDGDGSADTDDVLQIQVGLAAVTRGVLVIETAMILDDSEVQALGIGSDILLKESKVRVPRILLQIASESYLVAI